MIVSPVAIVDPSTEPRLDSARHASPRLLADIGGTNARFALETAPGRIGLIEVLPCAMPRSRSRIPSSAIACA
jgi:glucokinase